jgi:hypothetical protein
MGSVDLVAVRFLSWERVQAKALRAEKPHLGDFSWWLEPQVEQNQWFSYENAMVIGKSPNLYAFVGWRPSMGMDPLGTSDLALEFMAPRKAQEEAERVRRREEFCRQNPETCQRQDVRAGGFIRAGGGGLQVAAGAPMIAAPEPVATKAAGWTVIARGLDNIATGIVEMWTGESLETTTHEALEWGLKKAGATEKQANFGANVGEVLLDLASGRPRHAPTGRGAVADANFAQSRIRADETFSLEGQKKYSEMAGRTIKNVDDLASAIKDKLIVPSQAPVDYVNPTGNKLILNTRTSVALDRAGVPKNEWYGVDRTGQAVEGIPGITYDDLAKDQLKRNKLPPEGYPEIPKGKS